MLATTIRAVKVISLSAVLSLALSACGNNNNEETSETGSPGDIGTGLQDQIYSCGLPDVDRTGSNTFNITIADDMTEILVNTTEGDVRYTLVEGQNLDPQEETLIEYRAADSINPFDMRVSSDILAGTDSGMVELEGTELECLRVEE